MRFIKEIFLNGKKLEGKDIEVLIEKEKMEEKYFKYMDNYKYDEIYKKENGIFKQRLFIKTIINIVWLKLIKFDVSYDYVFDFIINYRREYESCKLELDKNGEDLKFYTIQQTRNKIDKYRRLVKESWFEI